jgi:ADP-ribose pyrophosphatase YjhB (NUDIX family)
MHQKEIDYRFCPVCGGELQSLRLKTNEPERLVCSACDFVFYLDPKVVACSLIELEGKILLLRRSIEPARGKWVIPGGYVDRGEEVREAAVRETLEECRLDIDIKDLLGVYSYTGEIPVVVVFLAEIVSGEPASADETLEVRWFAGNEIPWETLAFRSTRDALRDYASRSLGGNK